MGWKRLKSRQVYSNKWLSLREDTVVTPDGSNGIYSVVELANDFLYIVGTDAEGLIYLTKQYRYPVSEETWELPAGQTDGERPEAAAKRELMEETGLLSSRLTLLGRIYGDSGVMKNSGNVYLAENSKKTATQLDPIDGIISSQGFSVTEIHEMIIDGKIRCPHTISAFYLAKAYLEKK